MNTDLRLKGLIGTRPTLDLRQIIPLTQDASAEAIDELLNALKGDFFVDGQRPNTKAEIQRLLQILLNSHESNEASINAFLLLKSMATQANQHQFLIELGFGDSGKLTLSIKPIATRSLTAPTQYSEALRTINSQARALATGDQQDLDESLTKIMQHKSLSICSVDGQSTLHLSPDDEDSVENKLEKIKTMISAHVLLCRIAALASDAFDTSVQATLSALTTQTSPPKHADSDNIHVQLLANHHALVKTRLTQSLPIKSAQEISDIRSKITEQNALVISLQTQYQTLKQETDELMEHTDQMACRLADDTFQREHLKTQQQTLEHEQAEIERKHQSLNQMINAYQSQAPIRCASTLLKETAEALKALAQGIKQKVYLNKNDPSAYISCLKAVRTSLLSVSLTPSLKQLHEYYQLASATKDKEDIQKALNHLQRLNEAKQTTNELVEDALELMSLLSAKNQWLSLLLDETAQAQPSQARITQLQQRLTQLPEKYHVSSNSMDEDSWLRAFLGAIETLLEAPKQLDTLCQWVDEQHFKCQATSSSRTKLIALNQQSAELEAKIKQSSNALTENNADLAEQRSALEQAQAKLRQKHTEKENLAAQQIKTDERLEQLEHAVNQSLSSHQHIHTLSAASVIDLKWLWANVTPCDKRQ